MPISDLVDRTIKEIMPLDETAMAAARARQDQLTKPPGSLGRLEELSIQLAGIFGEATPSIRRKTVILAAGDHGVVAEGVSAYPQDVTPAMVMNFLGGGAAINVLSILEFLGDDLAASAFTDGDVAFATANIAGHEALHLMGARHHDAHGPLGTGIGAGTPPRTGAGTPVERRHNRLSPLPRSNSDPPSGLRDSSASSRGIPVTNSPSSLQSAGSSCLAASA